MRVWINFTDSLKSPLHYGYVDHEFKVNWVGIVSILSSSNLRNVETTLTIALDLNDLQSRDSYDLCIDLNQF